MVTLRPNERTDEEADQLALETAVQKIARPLTSANDLDALMDRIGDARFVLLGEASHGTSDYYTWRMRLSLRLIEEKGFSFIAVEGDWPDCYRVNRYIKGYSDAGASAREVLHAYERWPTWMWANWEIVALSEWLRDYNAGVAPDRPVGFYGLDVYSLWESLDEINRYLKEVDPEAAEAAKRALVCFQPYDRDVQAYAWATRIVPASCERDVVDLLLKMQQRAGEPTRHPDDGEASFNAEQNALVAVGAERYYRAMIEGGPESWNIRDRHMVETLARLMKHHGPDAKVIVWEHNTHIGDARFTDMAGAGMVNVGQLVREHWMGDGVVLVGLGSHRGTVIAGDSWGAPMQVMPVPEGRAGSWEDVLHRAIGDNHLFIMNDIIVTHDLFRKTRPHRAIGVVYSPDHERYGNYVPSSLSRRYDAFVFIDESEALHPLHLQPEATEDQLYEPPDTYPWAV